jgi:serine/threonine protein kinase/Flp pilus assembly protein TadD
MNNPSPLEAIFFAALEKGSRQERAAYLDEACAGAPDLRARIEKMLAAQAQAASFLEQPARPPPATIDAPITERPGTVIGPYKLMEQIGEGGMGLVFVAEQQHPVRRKVALKVIKPGMDTRAVIARFEAERQALALMDHPNIAKVLDGGETAGGRPYFVMELVKGVPITDHCDQNHLPVRERLELFLSVCEAVQHAHQKGIIHRDIKPSNVLVMSHDGKPVVRVIDFGVAKAIGQQLTDKSVYTQFAQLIGTPLYMSPEQAGESSLDVDTRSDIYSLGVLLYELLTGTTPFDRERLKDASYEEIRRIIREEEPPKPSTRISTLGQAATTVSTQRKSDPRRLSQLFRGELDWIVMKCLDKDRTRRYDTAIALAADVRHYLNDEPVQACPPSAAYRFRKLMRRNKALFATATVVGATLLAASAVVTWKWLDADTARQAESLAKDRANEALALARERGEQLRQDVDGLNTANGLVELAHLQANHGQWDQAEDNLTQAIRLRPDNSYALSERGQLYIRLGLWDLANADCDRACSLHEPASAQTTYEHAILRLAVGDRKGYDQICTQMFERFGQSSDDGVVYLVADTCTAAADPVTDAQQLTLLAQRVVARHRWPDRLNALGRAYFRSRQYEKAIAAINDSLAVGPNWNKSWNHALLAMARHRLGRSELARQELHEAAQAVDKVIQAWFTTGLGRLPTHWWHILMSQLHYREAKELIDGSGPREDARLWVIRSRGLAALKRGQEAAQCHAKAVGLSPHDVHIRLALLAPEQSNQQLAAALGGLKKLVQEHPEQTTQGRRALAQRYCDLGRALDNERRYEDAVWAYGQAIEVVPDFTLAWQERAWIRLMILKQYKLAVIDCVKLTELEPKSVAAWNNRVHAHFHLQEYDKALAATNRLIELDPHYATGWNNRGAVYQGLKQYEKAIADHTQAIQLDPENVSAWTNRGRVYTHLHHYDKALADLNKALELDPRKALAWDNRGVAYNYLEAYDKALADFNKAIELDPELARAWHHRGQARMRLKQWDEAIADASRALKLQPHEASFQDGLAWLLAVHPEPEKRQLRSAVELAQKAVQAEAKNGSFWTTLGVARYRAADGPGAVAALEKALKRLPAGGFQPGVAHSSFFLAMAQQKVGHIPQARQAYEHALAWLKANQQDLKKNPWADDELRRFRAEAEEVLGMKPGKYW